MGKINLKVEYEPTVLGKWKRYVPDKSYHHLQNTMRALNSAKDGIPTIPLYGKTDVSVVDDYYKFAQQEGITYPKWQLEYELSRKSKFGRQGGRVRYTVIKPDVEQYVLNLSTCEEPIVEENVTKFKRLGLQMRSLTDVVKYQKSEDKLLETANGWNRFELKKNEPIAQQIAIHVARTGMWKYGYGYPFTYIRKMKNRIFIPAPFSLNIMQAQYHDVLLGAIQEDLLKYKEKSDFTFFADKIGFYNLWPIMESRSKSLDPAHIIYVVRDFYHMDTTMGVDQKVKHYCPKVGAAFNLTGKSYNQMVEVLCASNKMPWYTPDGVITNELKGEASGATVTNQGESFDNEDFDYTFNNYLLKLCKEANIKVWRIDSYGNGDDGHSRYYLQDLNRFNEFKDLVDKAGDYACARYGHIKNEKWQVSNEFGIYCQYEIYQDSRGLHADYPVSLALNAIMHPMHEKPKQAWFRNFIDWRAVEILTHLYGRDDFVTAIKFVDNGMKYGLFGKTKEEFSQILSMYGKYRALRDVEEDFNLVNPNWAENPKLNPVIIELAKMRGYSL